MEHSKRKIFKETISRTIVFICSLFFIKNSFSKSILETLFDIEDTNIYINLNVGIKSINTKNLSLFEDKYNSNTIKVNSLNKKFEIQTGIISENLKLGFDFSKSNGSGDINFKYFHKKIQINTNSNNFSLNMSSIINLNKSFDFEFGGSLGIINIQTNEKEILNSLYEKYYLNFGMIFGINYNINETNVITLSLKPKFYTSIKDYWNFPTFYITGITSINLGYLYKF